MTTILAKPAKLFLPEKAEQTATEMQKHDEDWTYVVKHDPKGTGYSIIEIYDEENEFVGYVA
jgi:hypothetical protein